jgi:hypothetical protein
MHNIITKSLLPDWQETWTLSQIQTELSNLTFRGAGWYIKGGIWMLILPTEKIGVYHLMAYFDSDPRQLYRKISDAPVKLLDKE